MFFKQYYLGCLAHASYIVGDEESRTAVVIDPQRDTGQYIQDARDAGLEIRYVFLTHFHADFLAGHLELRDKTGARICLGERAGAEYSFAPFADGDAIELDGVRLTVLETPGHSPESISILVYDRRKDDAIPYAVLTGDTLFVGDVGRPDLRAAVGWSAMELAGMLYDSIHRKLLVLPDDTLVYPAHGAGSMCGKNIGRETVSTIGIQRRYNYALQPMSKERFISVVLADQPDAPSYFTYDAILNTKERSTLEDALERSLRPLGVEEILQLCSSGAQMLDSRDPAYFAAAHLSGSINVGLGGEFASWSGTILDHDREIVIVAEPGREYESAMRLGRIGFDRIAGFLAGGMRTIEDHPGILRRLERVAAPTAAERLSSLDPPVMLDVRTERERYARRIERSLHIPLNHLSARIADVPRERPLVVYCATGYRSSIAASLLLNNGFPQVADLAGGISGWMSTKLPTVAADAEVH